MNGVVSDLQHKSVEVTLLGDTEDLLPGTQFRIFRTRGETVVADVGSCVLERVLSVRVITVIPANNASSFMIEPQVGDVVESF